MTKNTHKQIQAGVPTSAQINTPEEEQITPEEEEEAAEEVAGTTAAVAVKIMVEAGAKETNMTLQRRAVTLEQFDWAA